MILCFDDVFFRHSSKLGTIVEENSFNHQDRELVLGIVVRLGNTLSQETLSSYSNLKFVATVTTGLDHIDTEYCLENKIQVLSLKGEFEFLNSITATPEHTWALLLSLVRKIPQAVASTKEGMWDRTLFFGQDLSYKTLGLVGYGRVGKIVAEYGRAFRMKVIFHDPNVSGSLPLEDILRSSDVISLHPPLEEETVHLIRKEHFNMMERKPFFINTSRGRIVKESDLLWALEQGCVRGAALDVLEHEIDFKDKRITSTLLEYLVNHQNLIITPHIAGSTEESMIRTALFIEEKILKHFGGEI